MSARWASGLALTAAATLTTGGGWLLGEQMWLAGKGWVAERCIERAWDAHLREGGRHRPWSWADTWPVAEIEVPRLGVRRIVLAGAGGSSLAFGPGHVDGTSPPNTPGTCAVAGHRDGWFAFLGELRAGDEVRVRTRAGLTSYRVVDSAVRPMWDAEALAPQGDTRLVLITCYPLDGLRRGPLRYVVTCRPGDGGPV